jgi:polysaccharide export outer membrane protein
VLRRGTGIYAPGALARRCAAAVCRACDTSVWRVRDELAAPARGRRERSLRKRLRGGEFPRPHRPYDPGTLRDERDDVARVSGTVPQLPQATSRPLPIVKRRLALALLVSGLAVPPACAHAQVAQAAVAEAGLRPGDAVRITVWRRPELSGEFIVDADGGLAHPLYRAVRLTDVSVAVAESRLKTFLATFESNPSFAFEPLLRVTISGEVTRPNLYSLRPETSVAQAVAIAGGNTARARSDRVRLLRDGRTLLVDLSRPESALAQMRVRSGDQIQVDVRRSVFRDYVTPAVMLTGATAAILNVILRNRYR